MKNTLGFIVVALLACSYSVAEELPSGFDFFEGDTLSKGQCGCWYYHPREKGNSGKVLGLGDATEESIYFKINGRKVSVGNWRYSYEGSSQRIKYSNESYKVDIISEMIEESRFSSSFHSIISINFDDKIDEINVFGECGC